MSQFKLTRAQFLSGLGASALWASASASGAADDWRLGPFRRVQAEPIMGPDANAVFDDPMRQRPIHWIAKHCFNPASVVRDGKMVVLFRAEDDTGEMAIGMHTSRLGYAVSDDGVHFQRRPAPVLYPDNDSEKAAEWEGGCEDPRLCEGPDGVYIVTYTQWNRKSVSLGLASSRDLVTWEKHGPAFAGTPYAKLPTKSAAIIQKIEGGRMMAAKIDGKYWMVFGEGHIYVAHSTDLIHWAPVETSPGQLFVLMAPRRFHFDSGLPEVGPPPLVTSKGIVMLYNGKNSESDADRDPNIGAGAYSGGQALLDLRDPTRLLARTEAPFIQPELPWEMSGQYKAGTTFIEGLSYFNNKFYLYYGSADTYVGLAVAEAASIDPKG